MNALAVLMQKIESVLGDVNARVGDVALEGIIRRHGARGVNGNGKKFVVMFPCKWEWN